MSKIFKSISLKFKVRVILSVQRLISARGYTQIGSKSQTIANINRSPRHATPTVPIKRTSKDKSGQKFRDPVTQIPYIEVFKKKPFFAKI